MIRFSVFNQDGPATQWPLAGAHVLGPDDVAAPGQVTFSDGFIEIQRRSAQAVALALPFDAGPCGTLMLQTCLLPDREEPYLLSLELARHRIKTFIVKSEEWQMFDLAAEHPAVRLWEEARQRFTAAINMQDPVQADRAAKKSLASAIEASERLAMAHAEILLHRRFGAKAAGNTILGVRVWPDRDAQPLRDIVAKEFDLVYLPIRWNQLEVEEGKYRWDRLDRWMQAAAAAGKPVIAGPLLDFSARALPKWLYVWQHDYDTCRDLAYDFIEQVVSRYAASVGIWSLGSSIHVNDNFEFKPAQMIDLVRMANLLVRQTHKKARTMVELAQPFGEYVGVRRDSLSPFTLLDQLTQEGIRVDCLGLQLLFGQAEHGQVTRDLMQISSLLDRFFLLETPVIITAAGVPADEHDAGGGCWREKWSAKQQATWASRLFSLAMSKPFVESVLWSDLYDHPDSELPGGGMISGQGKARPVLMQLSAMRKRLRKPLGTAKAGLAALGGREE